MPGSKLLCWVGRVPAKHIPTAPTSIAEVALCRPLWDPHGTIERFKSQVIPYPSGLKQAIIKSFWWEVDFSLLLVRKSISRGDVTFAAGSCFRAVTCLLQVLFAVNEQYWMNEKGAVSSADGFEKSPAHLKERVESAFSQLNNDGKSLALAIQGLQDVAMECEKWVPA